MRTFFIKNSFKKVKLLFYTWWFPFWFSGLFGSSRVQYVVDPAVKIVFLNIDPSIVMTYDAVQNVHSLWTLRRVKPEVRVTEAASSVRESESWTRVHFWGQLSFHSLCILIVYFSHSLWLKEENAVLKFPEQAGTLQNIATSSSLTAHLRSLSKGESPVASPFQNYSSIHSQSRSASSPSLHSRSPSISNMAALRWGLFLALNKYSKHWIPGVLVLLCFEKFMASVDDFWVVFRGTRHKPNYGLFTTSESMVPQ